MRPCDQGRSASSSFKVRDVVLPKGISEGRSEDRRGLRAGLDNLLRITEKAAKDPAVDFDQFNAQGVDLVTSKEAQAAFDIAKEDEKVREAYGRNSLGQRLLLARRLVEVGVSFVTVYYGGWDHHRDIFKTLKGDFNSRWDMGLAALINDLDQRGMMEDTMVICLGEFGRTPKVNTRGGRDHWSGAMSVLFAGGGCPRGRWWVPPMTKAITPLKMFIVPRILPRASTSSSALIPNRSCTPRPAALCSLWMAVRGSRNSSPDARAIRGPVLPLFAVAAPPQVDWHFPMGAQRGTDLNATIGGKHNWPLQGWCEHDGVQFTATEKKAPSL